MYDFIYYHLESGWHVTRSSQGLSLGREKSLGTRLNNKHLKSALAIRASDCQDLLAQIQRVLVRPEIERSQFKFRWLCFYGYSSFLNTNKYVYGKCRFSIVISCRCMSLLQYLILLFSYSKWFQFQKVFLSDLFALAKTLE